ncbi:hypothetical protein EV182_004294 [Spiromyces aspiralis]|uniref:Uncharacterized protein n=1 Tax=Spiromyces aspiralis TaxID=68401 RepID=A0ACC1HPE2_9FUNG|nr:hypothetical protein EV182_004294 [Spiromyces aspiralis]
MHKLALASAAATLVLAASTAFANNDLEAIISANYPALREKIQPLIDQFKDLDKPDYEKLTSALGTDELPQSFNAEVYTNIESALGGQSKIMEIISVLGFQSITEGLSAPTHSHNDDNDDSESSSFSSSSSSSSLYVSLGASSVGIAALAAMSFF